MEEGIDWNYRFPLMSLGGCGAGGVLASSWATLKIIGQDGYVEMAKRLMEITALMTEGIKSIPVGGVVCVKLCVYVLYVWMCVCFSVYCVSM